MDEKAIFAIVYPIWVVFTALAVVFVTAYFLPERRKASKKSFDHRVRSEK